MEGLAVDSLQVADWVLLALTVVFAVLGLFRGFSGTIAFVAALAASGFSIVPGWALSACASESLWVRRGVCLIAVLLVFGIVRWLIKKLVNGLLAQPTDAIFGMLLGIATGGGVIAAWAMSGLYAEFSTIVTVVVSLMN